MGIVSLPVCEGAHNVCKPVIILAEPLGGVTLTDHPNSRVTPVTFDGLFHPPPVLHGFRILSPATCVNVKSGSPRISRCDIKSSLCHAVCARGAAQPVVSKCSL